MPLKSRISRLSGELTIDNMGYSLLKLMEILKQELSPKDFSEITDARGDDEVNMKVLIKKYDPVLLFLEKCYRVMLSSKRMAVGIQKAKKDAVGIKKALILVGGKGTRLRPITTVLPKPLVPVGGITLTEQVINTVKRFGVSEITLAVGYKGDLIKEYFNKGVDHIKRSYTEEKIPMGTAGPLYLMRKSKEPFLMINGDNLFGLEIDKMYSLFKKSGALAVIALTPTDNPSRGGVIKLKKDSIIEFCEKLDIAQAKKKIGKPPYWLNSGYYIISPEVYDLLPKKQFIMMETDIFPMLAKTGKLFGFRSNAPWHDSGTIERYREVIKGWGKG